MSFYPHGDFWPLQMRVLYAHLEREALAQGLSERVAAPPVSRAPHKQYLSPSQPRKAGPRPSLRVSPHMSPSMLLRRMAQQRAQTRLPVYRVLACVVMVLAAALFGLVGVAILRSDLSVFATAVTLLIFGWALALTEVWALPSLYRWAYWRWLLVSGR